MRHCIRIREMFQLNTNEMRRFEYSMFAVEYARGQNNMTTRCMNASAWCIDLPTSKSSVSSTIYYDLFFFLDGMILDRMFDGETKLLEMKPLWCWRDIVVGNQAYRSNTPVASKFQCAVKPRITPPFSPFLRYSHSVRENLWIFSRRTRVRF
jgi:hypothetical protein